MTTISPAATTLPTGLSSGGADRLRAAGVSDRVLLITDRAVRRRNAGAAVTTAVPPARMAPVAAVPVAAAPVVAAPTLAASQATAGAQIQTTPDTPDATYPHLTTRHVALMRALQINEQYIASENANQPAASEVEGKLREMVAYPDALDEALGRSVGTTRQLLATINVGDYFTAPAQEPAVDDPTGGDVPDTTYPSMASTHVAIMRAVGYPEEAIAQIAARNLPASQVEAWIMEMVANPEGADAYLQSTGADPDRELGTTRAILTQMGLIAPGSDVTTPPGAGSAPVAGEGDGLEKLIKGGIIAIAAAGVAFLGWKFFKGRSAQAATLGMQAGHSTAAGAAALGGGGLLGQLPAIPVVSHTVSIHPESAIALGLRPESILASISGALKPIGEGVVKAAQAVV